ncbi:SurA N-terminal domain-containing protein [Leeia aquatica]|uniref:Periplasmic chaperone PpiD n=1 Tax=Leeia aquatica TaxID=2725557 RepID=A0A847RXI1_9NEIS|nr:SurA N-terminal domain-containing protein [Leeia aquatica]NLR75860.1 hypothetical protein [Leeia aquatica]
MFDFVENNRTAIKIVLGAVTVAMVIGLGAGYVNSPGSTTVAEVDGHGIDIRDLARRLQGNADAAQRQAVLQQMIQEKMLARQASRLQLAVTDSVVQQTIQAMPEFQVKGKFDFARYQQMLNGSGRYTEASFEAEQREKLAIRNVLGPLAESSLVSNAQVDAYWQMRGQQREIALLPIPATDYTAAVKLDDKAIKQYYDTHLAQYAVAERVKLEYVILDADSQLPKVQLAAGAVEAEYKANPKLYDLAQRRISHIMLTAPADAKPEDKAKVKAHAEALLAELKKAPQDFAAVAKVQSQDSSSAENGGDLGVLNQGELGEAALDKAAFSLPLNGISEVVESRFGYHILQVTEIKPTGLEAARPQIELKLKQQEGAKLVARDTTAFDNMLTEQGKSLKPVADKFGLQVRQSDWMDRKLALNAELNTAEVRDAVFQQDVLKGYNTAMVPLGTNRYFAARIVAREAARTKTLAEVTPVIRSLLTQQQATKLARAEAESRLKAAQAGQEPAGNWSTVEKVSRANPGPLNEASLKAVFAAGVQKLPAYVVLDLPKGGSGLVRISKVEAPAALTPELRKLIRLQMAQAMGMQEMLGYQKWLQGEMKVEVHSKLLQQAQ